MTTLQQAKVGDVARYSNRMPNEELVVAPLLVQPRMDER